MTKAIDAHQHFWRIARGDYGWLTADLGPIHRDFGPEDLEPHLHRHGIGATILVQAAPTAAETDFLLKLAQRTDFVAGVVGWCDLAAPDAPDRIAALAARGKLVGLRPMLQDLPDDAWMLAPELGPAVQAIIDHGLVFDALIRPRHLDPLIRLRARYPGLRLVIDHGGKPAIAEWKAGGAEFRRWRDALRELADSGVGCKLSGLVTEAASGWTIQDLAPYVEALTALFGPDRLIWGSDWPVVNLAGGYAPWREAAEQLVAEFLPDAAPAVFGGNAFRLYGRRPDRTPP